MRVLKHWKIYNRAAADASFLETFEVDLDSTLSKPGLLEGAHDRDRIGTRGPLKDPSNKNHSQLWVSQHRKAVPSCLCNGFLLLGAKAIMLNSHWHSPGLGQRGLSYTTTVPILGSADQGSFPKQSWCTSLLWKAGDPNATDTGWSVPVAVSAQKHSQMSVVCCHRQSQCKPDETLKSTAGRSSQG